jgi:hypothetical protein
VTGAGDRRSEASNDAMSSPQEKQAYLEPLIDAARRDPSANEDILVFPLAPGGDGAGRS